MIDKLFSESGKLFDEGFQSSGYSISVVQTPEGTKVKAKIGKERTQTHSEKGLSSSTQTRR